MFQKHFFISITLISEIVIFVNNVLFAEVIFIIRERLLNMYANTSSYSLYVSILTP